MLYKKNVSKSLDTELFKNPTSEYRGTPFWSWNCELNPELLVRQIGYLDEMGFGGFHMHSRTGMATPYLTKEFFDLIKTCVDEAKRHEMLAWLYDEDRWPSGAAGGIVTKNPKYRQRYLHCESKPYDGELLPREDAVREGGAYTVATFAIKLDDNGRLSSYRRIDEGEVVADGEAVWHFTCVCQRPSSWYNNQTYIDTLSPEAVDEFIRVTYDAYKENVGEDFGGTIPAIFTDEPQFAAKGFLRFSTPEGRLSLPWTPTLPETFYASYGFDIVDHLPELIYELPDGKISRARYLYHDHVSELFASSFLDRCGEWCAKNGIDFTGHLMEEPTLYSQTRAVGDAMRSYRNMQIPGIDMLCDRVELTTAKQAQSAVHQYGREGMMSELYGVTNWDFDFRGHKFQGDWQAALGVTVRVPHLSWVSMEGDAKRDYPASISYQSPWFRDYRYVEDHFARVNTALTRGKPLVKVAVIHPVESYWLYFGPNDATSTIRVQLDENFENITRWLLEGAIDFDFICESLLPSQYRGVDGGLHVGEMTYTAVVVPECHTLRSSTLDILRKFKAAGGNLIFAGSAPKYVDAQPSLEGIELYNESVRVPFSRAAILSALESKRIVSLKNADGSDTNNLIYAMRRDESDSADWLFLAHSRKNICLDVSHPQRVKISVRGEYTPLLYDTITGEIKEIEYRYEGKSTVIETTLYAYDSLLLKLNYGRTEPSSHISTQSFPRPEKTLFFRDTVPYTLSEPNVLLLDMARYAADDMPYSEEEEEILRADNICRIAAGLPRKVSRPAQPWVIKKETPSHKIRLLFTIESEIDVPDALLAIERPENASITFNGEAVQTKPVGYFTDEAIKTLPLPTIKRGVNTLEVILPLGERTCTEWCYILGNFGVRVEGCKKTLTEMPQKVGFGSITTSGMPFYGGNITYKLTFDTDTERDAAIFVGTYRGAAVKVKLDGRDLGVVAYEPYIKRAGAIPAGRHELELTLLGTRHNCFGALHDTDYGNNWYGPDKWRTTGDAWCYEYKIRDMGIMTSPVIYLA